MIFSCKHHLAVVLLDVVVFHTIKFIKDWGMMQAQKNNKYLWMTRKYLEEVHTFLENDVHNVTLQLM